MSAKVKMPKKERVPSELFSQFAIARARMLQRKIDGEKRIETFIAQEQAAVSAEEAKVVKVVENIFERMKLDPKKGDKFDSDTGIVTRG